jgi:hypothetical protein
MGRVAKLVLAASLLFFAAGSGSAWARDGGAHSRGWGGSHGGGGSHGWGHGHHGGWGHGHHDGWYSTRLFLGVGPVYWPYYSPYWWGPPGYWYPPTYGVPYPREVVEDPPVYIERERAPDAYWYFCESAGEYYPYVRRCPEEWVKVPPRPE